MQSESRMAEHYTKENNMSSSHDLHATTKQVISSRLLEENGREMY